METLNQLLHQVREIRGAYQVAAIALVAAAVVAFIAPLVAGGIIVLGLASLAFGATRGSQPEVSSDDQPEVNPARGRLFAVADDHVPQTRPPSISQWDWVVFRHLKSDATRGIGKTGALPARYFVDLREASLIPSQCEFLTTILCDHIRDQINIENHHAVIIPKSGNANLGMAVAAELGLAPVIVREWPFYGRWVETLVASGRAILVDDVSALGEMLLDAAEHARDAGFIVSRAFLLIHRTEGTAPEQLEKQRLSLSAVHFMNDDDFDAVVERVRQA